MREIHIYIVYQFLGAAELDYHKLGGLKKKPKIYFLTVLEPRSLKSRYQHGHTPFDIFPVICWQSLAILGLKLPKSSNFTFSLCVSVFIWHLIRMPNCIRGPLYSSKTSSQLITSAMTFFFFFYKIRGTFRGILAYLCVCVCVCVMEGHDSMNSMVLLKGIYLKIYTFS